MKPSNTSSSTTTTMNHKKEWIVLKFGGTSVATFPRWKVIAQQSRLLVEKGYRVWIVISALSQVTNLLEKAVVEATSGNDHLNSFYEIVERHLELAKTAELIPPENRDEIIKKIKNNEFDETEQNSDLSLLYDELKALRRLLDGIHLTEEISPSVEARAYAFGELLSTAIGIEILHKILPTFSSIRVDSRKLLIASCEEDSNFQQPIYGMGDAGFLCANVYPKEDIAASEECAKGNDIVLAQGFIASTPEGKTCVLGRGGSDTSGSLFAALIKAKQYQIWTDVHGMYTSDPRDVPSARLIKILTYQQAAELAAMGAKVLHSKCIGPAQWAKIPVEIRNTQDPEGERTIIMDEASCHQSENPKIMAVVKRTQMTLLNITNNNMFGAVGFLSKIFSLFENMGMSVDLIATSQFTVSLTLDFIPGGVDGEIFKQLLSRLHKLAAVEVLSPCAVVSIVGRKLRKALPEIGRAFEILKERPGEIYLLSESAEDLNLSFVVDQQSAKDILIKMHEHFFPVYPPLPNKQLKDSTAKIKDIEASMQRVSSRDCLLGSEWSDLQKAN